LFIPIEYFRPGRTNVSQPGYSGMEPFNIKLSVSGQTATLTILPADLGLFKIVYYGAVMGAVRAPEDGKDWTLVPEEELVAGDLPFYQATLDSDRVNVRLDDVTVKTIGAEIQNTITTGTDKEPR
jgi:hypothetical protein